MRVLESRLERQCCRLAERRFIPNTKLGQNGYPDRIFWAPGGAPFLVEFKRPGEWLSARQGVIVSQLKEMGYHVYVCDSIADFEEILNAETANAS